VIINKFITMKNRITKFLRWSLYKKINYLSVQFHKIKTKYFYSIFLKRKGNNNLIINPFRVSFDSLSLGENVFILDNARIEGINSYKDEQFNPNIIIENNVSIQQNCHLTCAKKIHIGKDTAIASNVTITDINHKYYNIDIPVEKQDIEVYEVEIGNGTKIYNNAVILPGVIIGDHCVIGANSVVNKNIPDYSGAVGAPARVIKQYDFEKEEWVKVNHEE